ncbi:MAG: Bug family tripartite tricarboxylate transporter substrate binding protein [Burkholderiaceae bacterium]
MLFGLILGFTPVAAQAEPIGGMPAKPLRILVGFAAGGAIDLTARVIAPKLGEALGQPVVVESKPGASSNLATELLVKSPPDGLTIFMGSYVNAVLPSTIRSLSYDPLKDLTPIGRVVTTASVLLVANQSPLRSLDDLVAQVKARPGQVSYSSSGTGSASHLAGNLLANRIGSAMLHVPYKGSPQQISDMIGGQVDVTFAVMSGALAQLNGGKARALGVTSPGRSRYLPEVPAIAESGFPGYEQLQWYALFGPPGMSPAVVERLNREVMRVIQHPDVVKQFTTLGLDVAPSTSAELAELLKSEIASYSKIVRDAGIQPN